MAASDFIRLFQRRGTCPERNSPDAELSTDLPKGVNHFSCHSQTLMSSEQPTSTAFSGAFCICQTNLRIYPMMEPPATSPISVADSSRTSGFSIEVFVVV